jgi:SAM-dependent methyltransferase
MEMPESVRRLDALSSGFQRSQILFSALRGDVFSHLDQPRSAEEIATRTGWHPRGARMLLDGLLALELVEKENGLYRNAAIASECLVPGAPYDQRHILAHKANNWAAWSRLDEVVRTGENPPRGEHSEDELRAFILGMNDIAKESARGMIEVLDLSPYRRMLDVGGGPATYTIAFVEANPELHGTVFDLPPVTAIGREQVAKAGLEDRIDFVAGDLTTDELGSGYDLILVSNIIHSYNAETNQALVRKCYDALEPGGLLIVKDFLLDAGRTGPAFGLIFALHMFVNTEAGDTYEVDEVAQWAKAAGFSEGRLLDLTPQSRMWLAKK